MTSFNRLALIFGDLPEPVRVRTEEKRVGEGDQVTIEVNKTTVVRATITKVGNKYAVCDEEPSTPNACKRLIVFELEEVQWIRGWEGPEVAAFRVARAL